MQAKQIAAIIIALIALSAAAYFKSTNIQTTATTQNITGKTTLTGTYLFPETNRCFDNTGMPMGALQDHQGYVMHVLPKQGRELTVGRTYTVTGVFNESHSVRPGCKYLQEI